MKIYEVEYTVAFGGSVMEHSSKLYISKESAKAQAKEMYDKYILDKRTWYDEHGYIVDRDNGYEFEAGSDYDWTTLVIREREANP